MQEESKYILCHLLALEYWCLKILAAQILTSILRTISCNPPGSHPAAHQAAASRSDRRPVPSTTTTSSSWTCCLLQHLIADALPLLADHVRVQFDGGGRCGRCDVQLGRGGRRHLVCLLHLVLLRSQNFTLHMESLSVSTYVWVCDLCSVWPVIDRVVGRVTPQYRDSLWSTILRGGQSLLCGLSVVDLDEAVT